MTSRKVEKNGQIQCELSLYPSGNPADALIKIGRIRKSGRNKIFSDSLSIKDSDRYHTEKELTEGTTGDVLFKALPPFTKSLLLAKEAFLILNGVKVRYILPEIMTLKGADILCRIMDKAIIEEIKQATSVFLAVDALIYRLSSEIRCSAIGMKVIFEGKVIAQVIDEFHNNAHNVIVAETFNGKEVLLPDVDEYVVDKDYAAKTISFINIREFLEF